MKKLIVIICIILSSGAAQCQTSEVYARFKYDGNEFSEGLNKFVTSHQQDFTVYIANYIAKNHHEVFTSVCGAGIAFAKFKVTSNGITDIACTTKSPELIISTIKKAIKASEKYWTVSDPSKEEVFILPWIYKYKTEGCDDPPFDPIATGGLILDDGTSPYNTTCVLLKPVAQSSGAH